MEGYRDPQGCRTQFFAYLIAIVLTIVLCLVFHGCRSLPPAVAPEVHNNYNGHDRDHSSARGDSIIIRDSIVYRWKHDTLFVDRWHTEFRDRWRHDTLTLKDSIHVQDSVPYPVYVDRPVPYKSGYTRFTSWFFSRLLFRVVSPSLLPSSSDSQASQAAFMPGTCFEIFLPMAFTK